MAAAIDVVRAFLKAQDDRDLDAMCELVTEDVVYINEPLPPTKHIHNRAEFRKFFESSPCIWGEDAELRVLRIAAASDSPVVLTERLDRFKVDGKWIEIPICGALDVEGGKVKRWKDYWDYSSYNKRKEDLFGPGFSLFRTQKPADRAEKAPAADAAGAPERAPGSGADGSEALAVVKAFLKAQDDRDLDRMCELVTEDVVYINEPLPPSKHIHCKDDFRRFFESSPCIWGEEADLRVLRIGVDADRSIVMTERLDRFKVDGKWIEIPICGALDVEGGKVKRWKDYWDYSSYAKRKEELFGPGFSLFRAQRKE